MEILPHIANRTINAGGVYYLSNFKLNNYFLMIPIGDDRLQDVRKPIVNIIFILINIFVFIQEIRLDSDALNKFIFDYGATPSLIMQGMNLETLLTSIFLHGGWMHLIGNMLFLWVFGDNIEAVLGHMGYIVFYLLGGFAATFAHVFSDPLSNIPSVGASGAISACLGAYLVMFPKSRVRTLIPLGFFFTTLRVSAWVFLGIWIVIQLLSSGLTGGGGDGGVAWWAHIGGFAFGILAGFLFRSRAGKIIIIRND